MPKVLTRRIAPPAAAPKPGGIVLPTAKTMPAVHLADYITVVFGQPGIGKTTFVNALSDRVLFASTDRGTRFLNAMRVECHKYEDFLSLLTKLEAGGAKQYEFLAIDHVDDWANMVETYVLQKLGVEALTDAGYGKGWSVMKKEIVRFMARVKALGMGIVFIAHEDTKKVKVRGLDVDKCQPLMSKQAWNAIIPLADIVVYCCAKPMKDAAGKRVEVRIIETTPREDLYAKDRTRRKRPPVGQHEIMDGRKFIGTFATE